VGILRFRDRYALTTLRWAGDGAGGRISNSRRRPTMGDLGLLGNAFWPAGAVAQAGSSVAAMKSAHLARLPRLESVQALEGSNRPLKVEFGYLKLLPRNTLGPVTSSRWASVPTGDVSTKSGPVLRHPIKSDARTIAEWKTSRLGSTGTSMCTGLLI
jgi:hypothetical protein